MLMLDLKLLIHLKFYISVGDERVARSRLATIIKFKIKKCFRHTESSNTVI